MSWKIKFIVLIFTVVLPFSVHASTPQEYLDFFKKYEQLGNDYDMAVVDMYSDEANVTIFSVLDGVETTTKMKGKKVKQMLHEQMDLIKKSEAKSDYSNISLEIEGNKATIKATRYASFKCFKDNKYFVVIETQKDGTMQIVEEFMEEPIKTHCEEMSEKKLEVLLKSMAVEANNNFPMMVDTETRLEKTSAEGKVFTYHYTMVNFMSSMINGEQFKASLEPNVIKKMCSNSTLRTYMDMGATLEHSYKGKDQMPIAAMQVVKSDCNPSDYGM